LIPLFADASKERKAAVEQVSVKLKEVIAPILQDVDGHATSFRHLFESFNNDLNQHVVDGKVGFGAVAESVIRFVDRADTLIDGVIPDLRNEYIRHKAALHRLSSVFGEV
jgi:hypothetical protein